MSDTYDGAVVFREGIHYAVGDEGHADLERPLCWVEGTTYRPMTDADGLHADLYHERHVDLNLNTGGADDVIELDAGEADAVKAFLAERRGQ